MEHFMEQTDNRMAIVNVRVCCDSQTMSPLLSSSSSLAAVTNLYSVHHHHRKA